MTFFPFYYIQIIYNVIKILFCFQRLHVNSINNIFRYNNLITKFYRDETRKKVKVLLNV